MLLTLEISQRNRFQNFAKVGPFLDKVVVQQKELVMLLSLW